MYNVFFFDWIWNDWVGIVLLLFMLILYKVMCLLYNLYYKFVGNIDECEVFEINIMMVEEF